MIDVIIPACRGAEATRRCVESVAAAHCLAAHEIIVSGVERGSFAAAVDEGVRRHADRDVVVLDSGTRVGDGWLDRLAACARREPRVATASPFCNHALRCGYPRITAANGMPRGTTLAVLDAHFAGQNAGASIDIPRAEPLCVFVAREALDAVGGYGEADFFGRASLAGYRHLLCADLFVEHQAEASLRTETDDATPEYIDREPARPFRRRVDLARLRESPRPRVLMVTHNWGGGVERHVADLVRLVGDRCEVLRLRPDGAGAFEIRWMRDSEELVAWIEAPQWLSGVELLAAMGVDRVHFHHVHGLPREVLDLPRQLGVPYDVTLHDYYPMCPRYHLSPGDGESCEEDAGRCERCLSRPAQWDVSLAKWRELFHEFLRGAQRVIAPSRDVVLRLGRHFPDVPVLEWPHPEFPQAAAATFKVALLGSVSAIKGARLLEACVADAAARRLPLHFHVVGPVDRPMATFPEAPLTIGGAYADDSLARLIEIEGPDAFLFVSQVAETYSYTLTAAMRTGLPIVATRVGAFAQRLGDYPRHVLVARDASPREVNDTLLSCLHPKSRPPGIGPSRGDGTPPDDYRARLAQPYGRLPRPQCDTPDLPPSIWFRPRQPDDTVSLKDLYDAGVRCGQGEARAYLETRIGRSDAELQEAAARYAQARGELTGARAELDEARRMFDRHERELQGALEAARARIGVLESSAFWRLTYPFRATVHAGKLGWRRLSALPQQARLLAPRLATAREIAKGQGVAELMRRVVGKAGPRVRPAGLRARIGLEPGIRPLHVPSSQAPLVSVIVPTYGQDLHTFSCLAGLAAEAQEVPLEVLVMDDCAPQPAARALREVTGVRFERNDANLGFLRNCNRGASLAHGEYLLFLNNDAMVGPGTIAALLDVFARFPAAGAAGSKLVYPDGRLQEAGAIVWRDGSAWNWGRGDDPDKPEYNYLRAADYCSAACLMVPAKLFDDVGRFDTRYVPAYFEDTDLCFKLREAGRPVYYQPAAEVVHFEGVTHGTDTEQGVKRHQVDNQARFQERWKDTLAAHRVNGVLPRLEVDRTARRRVLLVEACMLTPDQDSGSLRTWRLMKVMRDMGCKLTFVAANLERREPYASQLRQEGVEVLHAPFARSVDELLRDRGGEFDIVILARYYVASRHIDAVRRYAPRALLVFDTLDLHFLRSRRLAQLEKSATLAQSAESIYREEVDCFRRCDVTWVVSDLERDIVTREVPRATVLVQTNIHHAAGATKPFAEREGLLFVGGFRHPPNVDAAIFLAREIVPLLRERLPGVVTYLVGSNPPKAIKDLEAEGLVAVGFERSLEPWLERCRISVSPLRYGAGVKGKVNQAMSHGLPVVATRVSIEGMHLVEGEEVLVAEDAQAFADAVARLYGDEALWNRLSRAGIANVERYFSPQVAGRALEKLFEIADRRPT